MRNIKISRFKKALKNFEKSIIAIFSRNLDEVDLKFELHRSLPGREKTSIFSPSLGLP